MRMLLTSCFPTRQLLLRSGSQAANVQDPGAAALAFALTQNCTMRELDLSGNDVGDSSARHFAHALAANSTLRVLDLSSASLGRKGCALLAKTFRRHPSLCAVNLFGNGAGSSRDRIARIAAKAATLATTRLSGESTEPPAAAMPIRFHTAGYKDSRTNMLHLRVATPSGLESFVHVESAYDRARAERRAIGGTLRHQKAKQHDMRIHRFSMDRYAPNAPPPSFALSIPVVVERKYPTGIDRAGNVDQLGATRRGAALAAAPGWRDETIALVHSLAQKQS